MPMTARLVLEDGYICEGQLFGASRDCTGEVVFNTSMTGYQEILTDPSYAGQIVVMTYPHIGNYGITSTDSEADRPYIEGFIVRDFSDTPSNWRSEESLNNYLTRNSIPVLSGIDTRALVRHIRSKGAMRGKIFLKNGRSNHTDNTEGLSDKELISIVKKSPGLIGMDLVRKVSQRGMTSYSAKPDTSRAPVHIVAYDFGMKQNILRSLTNTGFNVMVVPAQTPAEDVLALNPDGIFLSNGPGDPAAVSYGIENTRKLIGRKPIFGICLGHQIIALALGGKTYKLKFGHRGGNQPVKNLTTNKIEITSHNHGFSVDLQSLNDSEVKLTHVNLNDQTLEGFRLKNHPVFCVQYHPEAAPGPHDSAYLFEDFYKLIGESKT
jgi:carbamoyl-phosphate synthase small subunit